VLEVRIQGLHRLGGVEARSRSLSTDRCPVRDKWTNGLHAGADASCHEPQATIEAANAAGVKLIPVNGTMQPTPLNCLSCSNQFIGVGEMAMKVARALRKDPRGGRVYQPDSTL